MKKYKFFRIYKSGKLAKKPICEIDALSEQDAWVVFHDREYWINYPESVRFVVR